DALPISYFEGELEDFAGKDVAGLRDVGGDQIPDFAFGAAHPGGIGVVTVLAGGAPHPSGSLAARGYQLFGTRINGQFGSEIASCPDTDGDGRSEIAIGEPGPLGGGYELAGCVHLVYGDPSFDGEDKSLLGGKETLRRRTFIGASSGDAFGHAIECADFDCDGKTDLIVGAPGANGGAGATYIIYNIANPDLPDVVSIADLGTPSLPGAILSGQHEGDQLGFALTIASDFDGDQKIDLIIGAPGTGSNRGSAWFVYGGLRPEGEVELTSDSCAFQAFELFPSSATVGTDGTGGTVPRAQLFGYSLSSGDATNNGRSDVVIGSPGFNNRGAVYIIDGASNAELPH
ncbi:MAG: integrin alpha, partial [Phycisphaerae bacterium]